MSHGDRMQDRKDDRDQTGQALYRNKHLPCKQSECNTEKQFPEKKIVRRNKDKNIKFK